MTETHLIVGISPFLEGILDVIFISYDVNETWDSEDVITIGKNERFFNLRTQANR